MNEPVVIDSEFKNLLPPLSNEEFEKLARLCQKFGILDPLKIWNGCIIDGHNRYQIAEEYGLNYEVLDMTDDFRTKAEVMQWIIDNQGARRNLTKSQLVQAWSAWERERAKEAKERQLSTQNNNAGKAVSSNLNEQAEPIRTASEVAAKIGVSENTYRDMKLVTEKGTPEQVERMNKGGKGNGVSAIAREIKRDSETVRVCKECGRELPITEFYHHDSKKGYRRNICKTCYNRRAQTRDIKGNIIHYEDHYKDIPDSEIGKSTQDSSIDVTSTIEEVCTRIKNNSDDFLRLIRLIEQDEEKTISKENNAKDFVQALRATNDALLEFIKEVTQKYERSSENV